jgi:DNA-binding SARP family transcriptional activator
VTNLRVSVLGPVLVHRADVQVDLGTMRQREIVAALALDPGRAVPSDVLIERVWGDRAPRSALATLHGYVAALRRALEPDRPPRAPATVLVTEVSTYTLHVSPDHVDEARFDALVSDAHALLAVVPDHLRPRVAPGDRERVEKALDMVDEALGLWRGTPYAELGDDPAASGRRVRLEGQRRTAEELRAVGHLALGLHDVVRGELEARTLEYPLHERWWALRAVALARESRQADALAVLDELRGHLAEKLGVDPSPPLQELRLAILRQDPSVGGSPPPLVAPATPAPGAIRADRASSADWDLVGRSADLARLHALLDGAAGGKAGFVVITGGPGVGKSRLVAELAVSGEEQGFAVAIGQCSQDEGAPPYWPWFSVLEVLDAPYQRPDPGLGSGGHFRARADIVAAVRRAATQRPLLVVMEDLHWADASTLGVLRLLLEMANDDHLVVAATWRSPSDPDRDLSGVAEAFARRHAVRRELRGLDEPATRALFEQVSGTRLSDERAIALHERTGGHPFFVVELARLAGRTPSDGRDPGGLAALPANLTDVMSRRLTELPETTKAVLRSAAVIGRSFDLGTLGDLTGLRPDELLDAVEPAVDAGMIDEEGVEVFRFSHALVHDVLCSTMGATRLARTHALVAGILAQRADREAEVAWHWRAAGPRHVAQAWRAARDAAHAATRDYGYDDAAELLETALALQAKDPEAGPRDELALLHEVIEVYRWAAMRPELVAAVERGIGVARSLDDVLATAFMAVQVNHQTLWRAAPYGAVNETVVGALRHALASLPDGEPELRCRVLISLANELRHESLLSHRRALVTEAGDLARRLGDPALVTDVLLHEITATWVPATAEARLATADEAVAVAGEVGDRHAAVLAAGLRTALLGELGRAGEMWQALDAARAAAEELRMVYIEVVCDELELAWRAAAGDWERCDQVVARLRTNLALTSRAGSSDELHLENTVDLFALRLWQQRPLEALPELYARIGAGYPYQVFVLIALWRGGRVGEAAETFRSTDLTAVLDRETSFSLPLWCAVAEAASYASDRPLAARAYERLRPHAGWASGTNGLFLGPVDAFLALAAATMGEPARATRHADDAVALVESWDLPVARDWVLSLRGEHGF